MRQPQNIHPYAGLTIIRLEFRSGNPGNPTFLGILARIFGFWTPGIVPQGAHRDFLQVPVLNSSRSFTWTPKWPGILPGQHFVNFRYLYNIIFLGVPDRK